MIRGEATFVAEYGSSRIAEVGVDELFGYDSVTEEGLAWGLSTLYQDTSFETRTICKMCIRLSSIRGSVVPATSNQSVP